VNIVASGDILKLYFQDSNKYAGLLLLPVLSQILEEFTVSLTATLTAPQSRQGQNTNKDKIRSLSPSQECSVRIIVNGLICEKNAVSDLLSGAGLYLQHPSPSEYDRRVEYFNPQYLLRPGSQMPKLEELMIASGVGSLAMPDSLDEADKSLLMRIFDSANAIGAVLRAEPSTRLRTTLKEYVALAIICGCINNRNRHQLAALAMMTEKELGILEGTGFPSLWEVSVNPGATTRLAFIRCSRSLHF
jgi:hypothetical protein